MSRKATKIITAIICAVLALALIFTMIVGALAAEVKATVDTGDTGVILKLPEDGLVSNLEGMKLKAKVVPITKESNADVYDGMLEYNDNTYFDGKHVLYMVASELYLGEEYEGNAEGVAISARVLSEKCTYYLPLNEQTKNYQNLNVVVYDGNTTSLLKPICYKRTVEGASYLVFENDMWATVAVICDADASGNPIVLPFYLQGFFGFMHDAWFVFVFAVAAIALFLAFYLRRPKKAEKPAEAVVADEQEPVKPEVVEDAKNDEPPAEKADEPASAPKFAAEGTKPAKRGKKHVPQYAADKKKKG